MNTQQKQEVRMRQKRKLFHVQMHHMGIMNTKAEILASVGVDSTMELTENELDDLIYRLKQMELARYEATPLMREWRSNVLTVINQLGIYANNGDWSKVNAFLLDSRIAGKLMYEMTVPELKALHRKLKSIQRKQKPLHKIEYSLN